MARVSKQRIIIEHVEDEAIEPSNVGAIAALVVFALLAIAFWMGM